MPSMNYNMMHDGEKLAYEIAEHLIRGNYAAAKQLFDVNINKFSSLQVIGIRDDIRHYVNNWDSIEHLTRNR